MNATAVLPASARRAVQRFLRWWGGELVACLPATVREVLSRNRQRLVIEIGDTKATFSEGRGKVLHRLGAVMLAPGEEGRDAGAGQRETVERIVDGAGMRSADVILRLPRDKVLRRLVDLPVAAAENLREVLGFEMDRHTPFKSQEVYYDFRIKGGDAQRKRIKVDLVVIPRAVVDRAVRVVNGWGLDLNGAELAGGAEGAGQVFDLLPSSGATAERRLRRRLYGAAAVAAAVVAIAVAYLPLRREEAALALMRGDLEVARAAAAEVDRMRRQVVDLQARSRFVVDRKRRQRSVTEILDEVTRRLPDHTWALKFVVRDRQITVSGYSAKPSSLIAVLEESEMLSNARFSSPVTMDQKVGLERFNLTAEITPRGGQ